MEQLSIFEIAESTAKSDVLGTINFNVDETDYLVRGEKILTLLRNKKHKAFIPSQFFEMFNVKSFSSKSGIYEKFSYFVSCAEKILQLKWKEACENNDFSSLISLLDEPEVSITRIDDLQEPARLINEMLRRKKKKYTGTVKIKTGEDERYAPCGDGQLTKKQACRRWRLTWSSNWYDLCNLPDYFAVQYLFCNLRKKIQDEISDLTPEQLEDNRVANLLKTKLNQCLAAGTNEYGCVTLKKGLIDIPYIREFVVEHGLSVSEDDKHYLRQSDLIPIWFMSNAPYSKEISCCNHQLILDLVQLLYDVYLGDKQTEQFLKEVATEYAKVYQTKKAIPDKVINAMSKSGFNDYFGYIEFDEECDLKSLKEIEKEFRTLQQVVFHQNVKKEEVSLRFRKLGRHHAAGLYFPTLKCLCVDVRTPSSMAHEYGHMLDYENGCVSKGMKFSIVRAKYTQVLVDFIESLPKEDTLRMRWKGNTKYNKAYYLEPTEIFARSLEMYLVRVREIDNSLVQPEGGFDYPDDEELMLFIKNYFDEFFDAGSVGAAKKVAVAN